MNEIKFGSLFDGSGGFPLAGAMYGMTTVWASEIEPYPIRVTTKRLPYMKHYGDISKMNGAEIEPVDVICGGSPCQDMSVAGKRAGLDGERSCLFREQIRIIKEMREETNGQYPRFMLWENVPGAFSSNKGDDFRCVLEETARIKDPGFNIPLPEKGKWSTAGLIMGDGFSIGWRVLDAQYWGVPQRRRRIFLVADFSGTSSGEILFKREGLSWHFTQSRESWQTVAGNLAAGIDPTGEHPVFSIDREAMNSGYEFDRAPGIDESETAYTLKAAGPGGVDHPAILEMTHADEVIREHDDGVCPMNARMGTGGNQVPLTMQIRCGCEGGGKGKGKGALIQTNQSATLSTHNVQTLFQPIPIHDQATRFAGKRGNKADGKGNGLGVGNQGDPMNTLTSADRHAVCKQEPICYQDVVGSCCARDYKGVGSQYVDENKLVLEQSIFQQEAPTYWNGEQVTGTLSCRNAGGQQRMPDKDHFQAVIQNYIVRRLTPLECARLQGFPDWWTADLGTKDEDITEEDMAFWREVFETHRKIVSGASKPKTDNQIRKWLIDPNNDSAEYKMWGNGVALPCVLYVMEGIALEMSKGGDANDSTDE